ncbi:uncharacterized protein [Magallana gigas]|uniref:uncharacterized protein n=1 Tax=Magallana gigas TaxID=29159 RepID=UPI00333EB804
MLSKLVRCYIEKGQCIHIGGKNTDVEGEHILVASEIDKIGQISNREGQVFLQTFRKNAIAVNGQRIVMNLSEQRINSGDRLMFGSLRSLWIFVDPTSDKPNVNEDDFTYDDAENEIIMLTNTEETIPADDMALRRKLIKRAEEVKEANFKAVLSNKPLVFSLTLTSGYFLGLNDESNVVIVKIWNRKNNCRYIWTENEFVRAMDDINEFKIDCENDFDPFDITPHSYTPVGVSFVKRDDSGRKQKAKNNKSDLLDQKGSKIGHLCSSFEVTTETPRPNSIGSQNRMNISINSATFDEKLKDRYLEVKCSFRLPYTTNEDGDPEEVETNESPGQAPIFNFTKQLGINEKIDLFPQFLLVRVWGIPRPSSDLYVERGDLAEIVEILDQKDDLIEGLRKERNEYKKQVEDLKKALQNKQNKI